MRAPLILALLVLAMLSPFLGRPLFIDDGAHYAMARDLPNHPWRPYDRSSDQDAGWERFGWRRGEPPSEANPPLYHYWTGLCGLLVGWEVPRLHACFLLLAWLSAVSFHALARRLTAWPWEATLLFMASPAFWLTATSLLLDNALLPCGLGALALLLERRPKPWRTWAGLAFLGLAPLAKYTGLVFWPVAAAHWLLRLGPAAALRRLPLLALPAAIFAAWCLWTKLAYGAVHIAAVADASWKGGLNPWLGVSFLSFFSGSLLFPCLILPAAWGRGAVWRASLLGGAAALAALLASPFGGFPPGQALPLAAFLTISLNFLAYLLVRRRDLDQPEDRLLLVWLACGIVAASSRGSGGWYAGRYFLIALPAAALLTCRLLETSPDRRRALAALRLGAAAMLVFGFLLAWADYRQARVNTELRDRLASFQAPPGAALWYPAHALNAAGHYLRPLGWKPASRPEELAPGDILLAFTRTLPARFQPIPARFEALAALEFQGPLPLRTFHLPSGAGFYGSIFGPLPFAFSRDPVERVLLLRLERNPSSQAKGDSEPRSTQSPSPSGEGIKRSRPS